jgi:hypothetical protein
MLYMGILNVISCTSAFLLVMISCITCEKVSKKLKCIKCERRNKFLLVPTGVLSPGSAHARPSAQPPIDTSEQILAPVSSA